MPAHCGHEQNVDHHSYSHAACRLAMLAFVAAAGAELATGAPVAAQLKDAPILIGITFFLFSAASLVFQPPMSLFLCSS